MCMILLSECKYTGYCPHILVTLLVCNVMKGCLTITAILHVKEWMERQTDRRDYTYSSCDQFVLLQKLIGFHPVKQFSAFHRTPMFITAFQSVHHLSLSRASSIQYIHTSHFLKIHFNIILTSTPGSPKWSLSLKFPPPKTLYTSLLSHIHAKCPAHLWNVCNSIKLANLKIAKWNETCNRN